MLLNYILPFTNNKIVKERLLLFQNIYALYFICYSVYSIYYWINTSNYISILNALIKLRLFLITDFLLCSNEVYIHHIAALYITHNSIIYFNTDMLYYISIILGTELSTFFLVIKLVSEYYQLKNKLTTINDLLFIITFIYTNIY